MSKVIRSQQCAEKVGDSKGDMDLTHASISVRKQSIEVNYEWKGEVPEAGSVLWVVNITSGSGGDSRQLGYKRVDGSESALFVYRMADARQVNLDSVGKVDEGTGSLRASFPYKAVADLGDDWKWEAILNVSGEDLDLCRP